MILSIIWSFILIVLSFYNLYDFILRQENITFELKGKTSSKILMSWRHIRSILDSKKESEVAQSCPTLCNPVECRLPGTPVHGIFQARILEWVAISFSRGSSRPRDRTHLLHCRQTLLTYEPPGKPVTMRGTTSTSTSVAV